MKFQEKVTVPSGANLGGRSGEKLLGNPAGGVHEV